MSCLGTFCFSQTLPDESSVGRTRLDHQDLRTAAPAPGGGCDVLCGHAGEEQPDPTVLLATALGDGEDGGDAVHVLANLNGKSSISILVEQAELDKPPVASAPARTSAELKRLNERAVDFLIKKKHLPEAAVLSCLKHYYQEHPDELKGCRAVPKSTLQHLASLAAQGSLPAVAEVPWWEQAVEAVLKEGLDGGRDTRSLPRSASTGAG